MSSPLQSPRGYCNPRQLGGLGGQGGGVEFHWQKYNKIVQSGPGLEIPTPTHY